MAKTLKIVGGFAMVGFSLPLLLLAFYAAARNMDKYPNTNLLFYLCPSSIISIGLDKASVSTAIVAWLLISASNAVLYAIPGIVVSLIFRLRNSK